MFLTFLRKMLYYLTGRCLQVVVVAYLFILITSLTRPNSALSAIPCSEGPEVPGGYVASHTLTTLKSLDGSTTRTAIAVYVCNHGNKLKGHSVIHCRHGKWIDEPPTCPPVSGAHVIQVEQTPFIVTPPTTQKLATLRLWWPAATTMQPAILHVTNPITPRRPSAPKCKYGLPPSHALCMERSSAFIEMGRSPVDEILDRHNYWRTNVSPPPKKPLPPLKWDPDLATMAERWAAQCSIDQTPAASRALPERSIDKPAWSWVGQNMFMVWGFSPNWTYCIDHWADERKSWQYGTGLIGSGIVGHYTQIIWQETRFVGCGRASCQGMQELLVCNYGPGGNLGINGVSPYAYPYIVGGPGDDSFYNNGDEELGESGVTETASGNSGSGDEIDETAFAVITTQSPVPLPPRGPQCRYGIRRQHAFCLDDSEFLIGFEVSSPTEILHRHNYWRDRVSPPAKTPLTNLKWDPDLATTAERWAAQCKMGHDEPESRRMPERGENGSAWQWVGQNICYSWGYSMPWTECVNNWAAERKNWMYGVGQVGGGKIGHYTQMIWADTLYVGCGKTRCIGGAVEYVLVCNYGPGGNVGWNGADPYALPYQRE